MSMRLLNCLVVVLAIIAGPALAGSRLPPHARAAVDPHPLTGELSAAASGQVPAPRDLAARSALPACGFAAVESFGPNGFQYCDSRNMKGDGF